MTRDRKLLIITGAALIALLVAIASFSLGVYVGVRGWTAGPPAVAGPGQQLPQQPDPGAQPPGAPIPQPTPTPARPAQAAPNPQLVGRVQSVRGEMITLDTPQGLRLFQLGEGVQVFRVNQGREEPASLDEVFPGQHLAVFGRIEGNGAKQLIAERLLLLPPPAETQP